MSTSAVLVSAYFQHRATNDEALSWAFDEVCDTIREKPQDGWNLVLELVRAAPDDDALAYVAAGPFEDWLCHHGEPRVQLLTDAVRADRRLQKALSWVWGRNRMSRELAKAIDALTAS